MACRGQSNLFTFSFNLYIVGSLNCHLLLGSFSFVCWSFQFRPICCVRVNLCNSVIVHFEIDVLGVPVCEGNL